MLSLCLDKVTSCSSVIVSFLVLSSFIEFSSILSKCSSKLISCDAFSPTKLFSNSAAFSSLVRVDTTFPSSISLKFLPDIVSFLFSSPISLLSTDNFSLPLLNSTSLSFPPLFTEFLPSLFSLRSEIFSLVLESSVRLLSVLKFSLTSDSILSSLVLASLSLSVPRLTSFLVPDRDSFLLLRSVLLFTFIVSFLSPSSVST